MLDQSTDPSGNLLESTEFGKMWSSSCDSKLLFEPCLWMWRFFACHIFEVVDDQLWVAVPTGLILDAAVVTVVVTTVAVVCKKAQ